MDSFIRLYGLYYSVRIRKILWPVYTSKYSIGAWVFGGMLLLFIAISLIQKSNIWMIAVLVLSLLWLTMHFWAVEKHYKSFYTSYPERMRYYSGDYRYLRYCIFKHHLATGPYLGDIDDAIAHAEEQSMLDTTNAISSHPFLSGIIALLFGIVGGSVGSWNGSTVLTVSGLLFVIAAFSYLLISGSRTPANRLKEFMRFLHWAKADLTPV